MKSVFKTITPLLIMTFMISCNTSGEKASDSTNSEQANKQEHYDIGLVLDNGKLWQANPETTTGVNNMIEILNTFSDKNNVKAYNMLAKSLTEEFTNIIQKCTMTGEAHDQLHIFIVPITEIIKGLASPDLNTCKVNYDKLDKHLAEYSKYFK